MGSAVSGLQKRLTGKKEIRILIVGLNCAGKTTMLYKLKLGEVVTTIPTIGFNVETVQYKHVTFTSWDVGGRGAMRPLWKYYYPNTEGLVFVVDSDDRERISDARYELQALLSEDGLKDAGVLIIANKQDKICAMSTDEVVEKLGMNEAKGVQWAAYGSSDAAAYCNLHEGLEWLSTVISAKEVQKAFVTPVSQTVEDAKTASGKLISPATDLFKRVTSLSWWPSTSATSSTTSAPTS